VPARLLIEYDGTRFHGWAIQPGKRTVESVLTDAFRTLLRRDVKLTVAGRTDRGVHALGQVASYDGPPVSLRSLNALLPNDVAVMGIEEMEDGWSARHAALSRGYLYRLHVRPSVPSPFEVGRALWWPHRTDFSVLERCASALVGEHDFTAFTPSETYHERFRRLILGASWSQARDDLWEFRIEADAFMRSMVRVLVGTMLEVAGDRRSLDDFLALLEGAPRSAAGVTAPPHGLYLESVRY
jgi:tRNA pseudouridine38-40 synthase